jgi:hypothetical protein
MFEYLLLVPLVSQQIAFLFERNMKLEFISLMLRIKNNQNIYKLKNKYFKKFCRKSKLIVKLLLWLLFIACVFVNIIPYDYLSIEVYFDSEMDFSLIKLIMNYILFIICLTYGQALVMYYWTILYLNHHFQQIKEQIQQCVKTGNSQLLIDAIHEHYFFTE